MSYEWLLITSLMHYHVARVLIHVMLLPTPKQSTQMVQCDLGPQQCKQFFKHQHTCKGRTSHNIQTFILNDATKRQQNQHTCSERTSHMVASSHLEECKLFVKSKHMCKILNPQKHKSFAILHLKVTSSVIPKSLAFSKIFTF